MARLACLVLLCTFVGTQALPQRFAEVPDYQIVGGHDADIADYPWQVSFRKYGSHICGGSILNEYWILTAAHCVRSVYTLRSMSIKVGATNVGTGGQIYKIASVSAHPQYDWSTFENDVGLVKLSSPLTFGDTVKAITIASSEPSSTDTLTVSGWGYLYHGALSGSVKLQAVDIDVVSRDSCNKAYSGSDLTITSSMICAAGSGKDTCQGDSGGPLINADGEQVGIVSWGNRCAKPGFPGVYTNLADPVVRSWISTQSGV